MSTVSRIEGLDVARAVAVLGMFGSHVGANESEGGWWWLSVASGFPSALFAVLAGVSMTMMLTARGTVPAREVGRADLSRTRARIATRGLILIVLGYALDVLETPVDIILANLGIMFLLATFALRWSTPVLLALAAVAFAVGGVAAEAIGDAVTGGEILALGKLWSLHYPALAWMGYICVGLVLGRLALRSDRTALVMAGVGAAGALATGLLGGALGDTNRDWFSLEAHSYTPLEMLQNVAVATAVIGACLWLTRRARTVLWPLIAAGSMALTLYVLHIIVIAVVGDELLREPSNVAFVALSLALIAFASAWRALWGQGPLERMMTAAANSVGDTVAMTARDRAPRV